MEGKNRFSGREESGVRVHLIFNEWPLKKKGVRTEQRSKTGGGGGVQKGKGKGLAVKKKKTYFSREGWPGKKSKEEKL